MVVLLASFKCSSTKDYPTFSSPNTTYVVNSTIDLKGEQLVLPKGCTLRFEKGAIKNGSIKFNNTRLVGNVNIRCDISGTVSNDTVQVNWFLDPYSSRRRLPDMSRTVQSVFDLGTPCVAFGKGYYKCHNIQIGKRVVILGDKATIEPVVLEQSEYDFNFLKNVFYASNADEIVVDGLRFVGELTRTILPSFKSQTIFGEPLIWVDKANKVTIKKCVFEDIENCTYCNKAYNYYGKKQGSCVCLWDVSDASYINCEQVNCRHDEQIWIIPVSKPIMETRVTCQGNYIHDMTPGPNSSAFTCVAGYCKVENNRVKRYYYPGSMFNVFAKDLTIRNNTISECYSSSVFDACESRYFHNDVIKVENNNVEATNAVLLIAQAERATIRNNTFKGLGLYYSGNNRVKTESARKYKYWYTDNGEVLPVDSETLIEGNEADFTFYDGSRSISGTSADYGTGEITAPQKYNNVGNNYGCGILIHPIESKAGNVVIKDNVFYSIDSFEGRLDNNNLQGVYPHTIRLLNAYCCTISGNVFNGAYPTHASPDTYSCISIYNYPDEMETLQEPRGLSKDPTRLGVFKIENNTFNVPSAAKAFAVVSLYPRRNKSTRPVMTIDDLTIKKNIISGAPAVSGYIQEAPVTINKESIAIDKVNVKVR